MHDLARHLSKRYKQIIILPFKGIIIFVCLLPSKLHATQYGLRLNRIHQIVHINPISRLVVGGGGNPKTCQKLI